MVFLVVSSLLLVMSTYAMNTEEDCRKLARDLCPSTGECEWDCANECPSYPLNSPDYTSCTYESVGPTSQPTDVTTEEDCRIVARDLCPSTGECEWDCANECPSYPRNSLDYTSCKAAAPTYIPSMRPTENPVTVESYVPTFVPSFRPTENPVTRTVECDDETNCCPEQYSCSWSDDNTYKGCHADNGHYSPAVACNPMCVPISVSDFAARCNMIDDEDDCRKKTASPFSSTPICQWGDSGDDSASPTYIPSMRPTENPVTVVEETFDLCDDTGVDVAYSKAVTGFKISVRTKDGHYKSMNKKKKKITGANATETICKCIDHCEEDVQFSGSSFWSLRNKSRDGRKGVCYCYTGKLGKAKIHKKYSSGGMTSAHHDALVRKIR